jgi:hypothetical protein
VRFQKAGFNSQISGFFRKPQTKECGLLNIKIEHAQEGPQETEDAKPPALMYTATPGA